MAFPPGKQAAPFGSAPAKGNPFGNLAKAHGKKKHHKGKPPASGKPNPFAKGSPAPMPPGMKPEPDADQMGGPPDMDQDDE